MPQFSQEILGPEPDIDFIGLHNFTEGKTLLDFFDSDNIYIIDKGNDYSYREIYKTATLLASYLLKEFSLSKGDRVVVRSENSVEAITAVIAFWLLGCIPSLVMPLFREEEVNYILGHIEPKLYLVSNNLIAIGEGLSLQDAYKKSQVYAINDFKPVAITPIDTAVILFTSGTTGKNKAAMILHGELLANALAYSSHVGLGSKDRFISPASMAFSYGMGIFLSFPIVSNASVVISNNARSLLKEALTYKCTVLFMVPTLYNIFITEQPQTLSELAQNGIISKMVSAGENLSKVTFDYYQDVFGIGIINGLGATEMTHIFLSNKSPAESNSLGFPLEGYTIELRDGENKIITKDQEVGYLHVKGITGCKYFRDQRQELYVTLDNFNKTNDLLFRRNGEYFYHSRADEMIITAGYNVSPYEIEDCIKKIPGVEEVLVCSQPDLLRNFVIAAYIKVTPGYELKESDITKYVKDELAPYKYPRAIFFVQDFPRTASGKLKRTSLKTGHFYNEI